MSESSKLPRDDGIPGTLVSFMARFSDEETCAALLRRWKYPRGFSCSRCGHDQAWYLSGRKVDECTACHRQQSLTSGTVFHGTRKPLRLWFAALFLFASSKRGISALELQRQLGLGSQQTAWTWLHKLRSLVGERAVTMLRGTVEVDETYVGGVEEGKLGRGADKKALVAAAIEAPRTKNHFGRVRLSIVEDASANSLTEFVEALVKPGSYIVTDGWHSYGTLPEKGFRHRSITLYRTGLKAHRALPGVHRVFALLDRMLFGTYQGAVRIKHLQKYLDEYEFRFNRRKSQSRGLVFQRLLSCAVARKPLPYWQIVDRVDPSTPLTVAA